MCFSPQRRTIFRHLNFKKCSEDYSFFNIFTSECAFRHSVIQFFDIWTSKSGPGSSVVSHFHFQMCLSPQARAFFQHKHVEKCSEDYSFLTFSLPNVLFATAAYNFSASELHKVVRDWRVLYIFIQNVLFATAACHFWFLRWPHDSAPAALTGLLFDWPDTRIIEKTQHFATSLTFGTGVSSFF